MRFGLEVGLGLVSVAATFFSGLQENYRPALRDLRLSPPIRPSVSALEATLKGFEMEGARLNTFTYICEDDGYSKTRVHPFTTLQGEVYHQNMSDHFTVNPIAKSPKRRQFAPLP